MSRVHPVAVAEVTDVRVDEARITFVLGDGREVAIPTAWSSRLASATRASRSSWRIVAGGDIVEWPTIDEQIGLWTLLGVSEDDFYAATTGDTLRG